MGQYIDITRENVQEQFDKLDSWLNDTVWKWAFLHEDMQNTIENCMCRWFKETENEFYLQKVKEFEESEDKDDYDDMEEWLFSNYGSRWWVDIMYEGDDLDKYELLWRYRNTIMSALNSNTYNEDEIYDDIDEYLGEEHK